MRQIFLSFLIILMAVVSASANDGIETKTNAIRKAYEALNGFSATFTQTLTNPTAKTSETRTGTIEFKKPLLVRWETKGDTPELLVITKNEVWDYFPDEDLAYKHPLSFAKDAQSLIGIITGQADMQNHFVVEKTDDTFLSFRLYPREATPQMTEVFIRVDPKTNLITTVEITDFYNNTNKIVFDNIKLNVKLSDKRFTFTPPSNVKIEAGTTK